MTTVATSSNIGRESVWSPSLPGSDPLEAGQSHQGRTQHCRWDGNCSGQEATRDDRRVELRHDHRYQAKVARGRR